MNLSEELTRLMQTNLPPEIFPKDYFVPVVQKLSSAIFFPLGEGIYEKGKWKVHDHYPILVLGEDCGNDQAYFEQMNLAANLSAGIAFERPEIGSEKYLNKLMKLLGEETMQDCFFSHAILGLRKGNPTDKLPSFAFTRRGFDFLNANQKFFLTQLEWLEPDVIIALGTNLPKFLAGCFPKQLKAFAEVHSAEDLTKVCKNGFVEIIYDDHPLRIVFIPEPS